MLTYEDFELEVNALSAKEVLEWDQANTTSKNQGQSWIRGMVGLSRNHPKHDELMFKIEKKLVRRLNKLEKSL